MTLHEAWVQRYRTAEADPDSVDAAAVLDSPEGLEDGPLKKRRRRRRRRRVPGARDEDGGSDSGAAPAEH